MTDLITTEIIDLDAPDAGAVPATEKPVTTRNAVPVGTDLPWTVESVVTGTNADLIAHIAPLYIPNGSEVRDLTWGRGAFWTKIDRDSIALVGSDVAEHIGGHNGVLLADFRSLPDADESADVVVLDPPYIHNPGKHVTDSRYNNAQTTKGMSHADIRTLYGDGMIEGWRILRPGGRLLVKGKSELESGKQMWSHRELAEDAEVLGLYVKDEFILVPTSRTSARRWSTQKHARKVHSFLLVLEKPIPKRTRVQKTRNAKPVTPGCLSCGVPVEKPERGPAPRYCSPACKQRAWRQRQAG